MITGTLYIFYYYYYLTEILVNWGILSVDQMWMVLNYTIFVWD